jgi:cytochrome c
MRSSATAGSARLLARTLLAACALLVVCAQLVGCDRTAESARAPLAAAANDGNDRGRLLSQACQACHSLEAGGPHLVGPNLAGIFGRAAGTAPGYGNYSQALQRSGIVWSPAELDRWLADPAGFLPGTTMAFTGYQSPADRSALIAFLVTATDPGGRSPAGE